MRITATSARESVLHTLAEQFGWLERWLAERPADDVAEPRPSKPTKTGNNGQAR